MFQRTLISSLRWSPWSILCWVWEWWVKKKETEFLYYRTSQKLQYTKMCFESLKFPSLIVSGIISLRDSCWGPTLYDS